MLDADSLTHTISHISLGISTTLFFFGVFNHRICGYYKIFVFFVMMVTTFMWEVVPDHPLTDPLYDISFILIAVIFFRAGIERKCRRGKCT